MILEEMVTHWSDYNNNKVELEKVKDNNIITYKERLTEGIRRKQQ
jgi:hypothetical protein